MLNDTDVAVVLVVMVILDEAVPPGTDSLEVTLPVVLFLTPILEAVTFTENEQDAPAARVAPLKLTALAPTVAEITPPPQLPVSPLGLDTNSPTGKISVKPTPVSASPLFGLLIVKL